jgi:hypothetical protein
MKTLSIIGVIWFPLTLISSMAFTYSDPKAALGWGMLGLLYAIPFAITVLIKTMKLEKGDQQIKELLKIKELKEKGILTEDEFQAKKMDLLKN